MRKVAFLTFSLTIFFLILGIKSHSQASVCSYYGENANSDISEICNSLKFKSNHEAEKVVDAILRQVGLERNFIIMECPNIENCMAVNLPSDLGQIRYIIYDNSFLKKVERLTGTDWAAISIMAHEVGHHLQGHTLSYQARRENELQADKFSGFVLNKLGASLKESQAAMNQLQSEEGSLSHPPKLQRLSFIAEGWHDAEKITNPIKNTESVSLDKKRVHISVQIAGWALVSEEIELIPDNSAETGRITLKVSVDPNGNLISIVPTYTSVSPKITFHYVQFLKSNLGNIITSNSKKHLRSSGIIDIYISN